MNKPLLKDRSFWIVAVTLVVAVDLIQLNFGTDPSCGVQSTLRIEREVNTPFSESRYFSYAQIQTEDHMSLLRAFESAAS